MYINDLEMSLVFKPNSILISSPRVFHIYLTLDPLLKTNQSSLISRSVSQF